MLPIVQRILKDLGDDTDFEVDDAIEKLTSEDLLTALSEHRHRSDELVYTAATLELANAQLDRTLRREFTSIARIAAGKEAHV